LEQYGVYAISNEPAYRDILEEVWNWIESHGCASHSDSGNVVPDILDEIQVWIHSHCYWYYINGRDGEQRYHFEPAKFREFLDELRQRGKE
jgi:hypothetical protein